VHFSELVYKDAAASAPIDSASLAYSGAGAISVQPVEMTGNGAHAAIVTLSSPLLPSDIFPTPTTISGVAGQIWGQPYPSQFIYPTSGDTTTTTSSGDPGAYANTNADGNSYLPAGGTSMLATAHNITDVGLGFVTPVLALNSGVQRDPVRGGVGMITRFDGTPWLLPEDVLIESPDPPGGNRSRQRHHGRSSCSGT